MRCFRWLHFDNRSGFHNEWLILWSFVAQRFEGITASILSRGHAKEADDFRVNMSMKNWAFVFVSKVQRIQLWYLDNYWAKIVAPWHVNVLQKFQTYNWTWVPNTAAFLYIQEEITRNDLTKLKGNIYLWPHYVKPIFFAFGSHRVRDY